MPPKPKTYITESEAVLKLNSIAREYEEKFREFVEQGNQKIAEAQRIVNHWELICTTQEEEIAALISKNTNLTERNLELEAEIRKLAKIIERHKLQKKQKQDEMRRENDNRGN